jgi:hypothetical protein
MPTGSHMHTQIKYVKLVGGGGSKCLVWFGGNDLEYFNFTSTQENIDCEIFIHAA